MANSQNWSFSTRRQFLTQSGQLALAVGLGLEFLTGVSCLNPNTEGLSAGADWEGLARELSGTLLRPGDPKFSTYARPFNLRYAPIMPQGIARCVNAQDVSRAILWARKFGLPIVPRCGGHSYAGFSSGTGLMIDVNPLKGAEFDAQSGVLKIGSGFRFGELFKVLQEHNVTITHGRCPTVGIAGFLLGGGIGFNMVTNGVGSDRLLETEVVTADGEILTANENQNSDLFWACRGGGGGNFGVNTSFSIQTIPVFDTTVFGIKWTQNQENVFEKLATAVFGAPDRLGGRIGLIRTESGVIVTLLGQFQGSEAELADILLPVYNVEKPFEEKIQRLNYWEAQSFLKEVAPPYYFQERSAFMSGNFSSDAIAAIFSDLTNAPASPGLHYLTIFRTGNKINEVAPDATAFVHRQSHWLLSAGIEWAAAPANDGLNDSMSWLGDFYGSMRRFATQGAYQNFPDPALGDWAQAYYGNNLARLRQVKTQYDPGVVFKFQQSISPAPLSAQIGPKATNQYGHREQRA